MGRHDQFLLASRTLFSSRFAAQITLAESRIDDGYSHIAILDPRFSIVVSFSPTEPGAVYVNGLSGDISILIENEEERGAGDFIRGAGAAQRNFGDLGGPGVIGVMAADSGCFDSPWRNGVDVEAVLNVLERQRFGKCGNTGFSRSITRPRGIPGKTIDGRNIDNLAVALLEHGGQHGLGTEKDGLQVHIDHSIPIGRKHLDYRFTLRAAGHIDQNVNTPPAV